MRNILALGAALFLITTVACSKGKPLQPAMEPTTSVDDSISPEPFTGPAVIPAPSSTPSPSPTPIASPSAIPSLTPSPSPSPSPSPVVVVPFGTFIDNYFATVPTSFLYSASELLFSGDTVGLSPFDQIDDDASISGFGGGTHSGTQFINGKLNRLSGTTATFASRFFDAEVPNSPWTQLLWNTPSTSGPLPNNGQTEGNVNMTASKLLLHLDSGSSNIQDTSGNNALVACSGTACPAQTSGVQGGALAFDGIDDYLNAGSSPAIVGSAGFAIGAWVKITQSQHHSIIEQRDSTPSGYIGEYMLRVTPSNQIEWIVSDTSNPDRDKDWAVSITTAQSLSSNVWHHVVAVKESDGVGKVYINGVLAGQDFDHNANLTAHNVFIGIDGRELGRLGISQTTKFGGALDEVFIMNRPLSATEVTALFARGNSVINFKARACATAACTGIPFAGPNGDTSQFFSAAPSLEGIAAANLGSYFNGRYFQYQVSLTGGSEITRVAVGPDHFTANPKVLQNLNPVPYTQLTGLTHELGAGHSGSISYQLSPNGIQWYWFNSAQWTPITLQNESNSAAGVAANISTFFPGLSNRNLFFRAVIRSNGLERPSLKRISIEGRRQ